MIEEIEEETYTLAVKLKTLPQKRTKTNGEIIPPHEVFNYRSDYHTSDRAEVRRSYLTEVPSSVYNLVQNFAGYWGEAKPLTANEINFYLGKFDDLKTIAIYKNQINVNTGKPYLIFTHNNKYTGNYSTVYKMVNQFNMYTSNPNLLDNAIIVDMDEFMRFYNDVKDDWEAQDNLKETIRDESSKVIRLINKDRDLTKALEETSKKLEELNSFNDYNISQEDIEIVRLYNDKDFLRSLGNEYVDHDYNKWDDLYRKIVRKLEIYKRAISSDYYAYANMDFNITLDFYLKVQKYIMQTYSDSSYPLIKHPNKWNKEKSEYETIALSDLPALDEYCARISALNTMKITIKNKKDEMIKYYLSRLNYKSDLIVCDVNSETLITKGEEE